MAHDGIPDRLRKALRDHRPSGPPQPVAAAAGIGHIAVAAGEGARRLVLVRRQSAVAGRPAAAVLLLTNEAEMATDADFLLPPSATGLPYALLAQTDLYGTVWADQLRPPIGYVAPGALRVAWGLPASAEDDSPGRGMPLRGRLDPRWDFKVSELGELQRLTRDCTRTFIARL